MTTPRRDTTVGGVPDDKSTGVVEAVDIAARGVVRSLGEQAATTAAAVAGGIVAGPLGALVAGVAAGVAISAGGAMVDAAEKMVGAAGQAVSDVGDAISSALDLGDVVPTSDTAAKPVTNIGAAADTHVVVPTTAALGATAGVLKSESHTLAGVRGGAGASTATTEASPETRVAAAEVVKAAENTDIGMAAHKAVKVDSRAQDAFAKIQALLAASDKTSGEKLTAVLKMEVIEDSSFKAFLGIAQAALRMDRVEGTDTTYHGRTSQDVSEFLTNLSEGFAKIFTPESGKSREGGAEEMNAAFAACRESMQVGIGKLPAMQTAVEASFKSGFEEAAKAAETAREEEAKKARAPQTARPSADALEAVAPKEKLSLKEVGKDSLKIAGSIALSLLVPGGFLIAMAACYMLRDKAPAREESLSDIDASLPGKMSSRGSAISGSTPTAAAPTPAPTPTPTPTAPTPAPAAAAPTPAPTPAPAPAPAPAPTADKGMTVEKLQLLQKRRADLEEKRVKEEKEKTGKEETRLVGSSRVGSAVAGVTDEGYDKLVADARAAAEKKAADEAVKKEAEGNKYSGLAAAASGSATFAASAAVPSLAVPTLEEMISSAKTAVAEALAKEAAKVTPPRRWSLGRDNGAPKEEGVEIPKDLVWRQNPMRAAIVEAGAIAKNLAAGGASAVVGDTPAQVVAGGNRGGGGMGRGEGSR